MVSFQKVENSDVEDVDEPKVQVARQFGTSGESAEASAMSSLKGIGRQNPGEHLMGKSKIFADAIFIVVQCVIF